jgi:hypothetical protein
MVMAHVLFCIHSIFDIHNRLMEYHNHIYKEFSYIFEEKQYIFRLSLEYTN